MTKMFAHEFFCRVVEESQTCTIHRDNGGHAMAVTVGGGVAAWVNIQSKGGLGDFCLSVEGGAKWSEVSEWETVSLKEAGMKGVRISSGAESIFLNGLPWVMGNSVPEEFLGGNGFVRWIFDTEAGPGETIVGSDGAVLGRTNISFVGGGRIIQGAPVAVPFETSLSFDGFPSEVVAFLLEGGGRFTADLHCGSLGPMVIRGAKGGVAVAVRGLGESGRGSVS